MADGALDQWWQSKQLCGAPARALGFSGFGFLLVRGDYLGEFGLRLVWIVWIGLFFWVHLLFWLLSYGQDVRFACGQWVWSKSYFTEGMV